MNYYSGFGIAVKSIVVALHLHVSLILLISPPLSHASELTKGVVPARSYSTSFNGKHIGSIIRVPFNIRQNSYLQTRQLTFEAWIKPKQPREDAEVLNKSVGDCKDDWTLAVLRNMVVQFSVANSCTGNSRRLESPERLREDEWYHIAGVWDSDSLRLFVNGKQVRRAFFNEVPSANRIDMSIGANNHWDGTYDGYAGLIDEVRYSDTARYREDFTPLTRLSNDDRTVLLYHFDEGSGETTIDSSEQHRIGYLHDVEWSDEQPAPLPPGTQPATVQPTSPQRSTSGGFAGIVLSGMLLAGLVAFGIVRSRRLRASTAGGAGAGQRTESAPVARGKLEPGIYLCGKFQVIDRNGVDISDEFSPKLRELLILIILHSRSGSTGISGAAIGSALWPDVDELAQKNSRGVAMKRLRTLVEKLGFVGITSVRGMWTVEFSAGSVCDYLDIDQALAAESEGEKMWRRISGYVQRGGLLGDTSHAWLDGIRSQETMRIVGRLISILDSANLTDSERFVVADSILAWEPLNERAMRIKVSILKREGRLDQALRVLADFAKDYEDISGHKYTARFEEIS
jgi:hypothetical protein